MTNLIVINFFVFFKKSVLEIDKRWPDWERKLAAVLSRVLMTSVQEDIHVLEQTVGEGRRMLHHKLADAEKDREQLSEQNARLRYSCCTSAPAALRQPCHAHLPVVVIIVRVSKSATSDLPQIPSHC